jgi:hypothetical protein
VIFSGSTPIHELLQIIIFMQTTIIRLPADSATKSAVRFLRAFGIPPTYPPWIVAFTALFRTGMRSPRRAATLLPIVILLLSGCCAIHPPVHPDLTSRLLQIKTVAVSPPYVMGYITSYHLAYTRRVSLPAAAASNLVVAVREQFGQPGFFVVRDLDLGASVFAPPTPPWGIRDPESDDAGYGPALYMIEGMQFKPEAFTAPAPETGVDAAIFTFAWEDTKTLGGMDKTTFNLFTLFLYPLLAVFDLTTVRPDSSFLNYLTRREVCLGICLIDCHTGELLWSDIECAYGGRELNDPETSKRLVSKARAKLSKYLKLKSTSNK